jgi:transcriptional regulator with XRE-family HTH domain
MNAKEIKEKRKKLGITQKKLAELLGVSFQTVNGYENGKEIPTTKHQILDKILNSELTAMVEEPVLKYQKLTDFDKKIYQIEEEISERNKIIDISKSKEIVNHQKKIIELLKIQIQIILEAEENMNTDDFE